MRLRLQCQVASPAIAQKNANPSAVDVKGMCADAEVEEVTTIGVETPVIA